ncbi:MAG: hypothetical protein L3J87_01770 [Thermoplasmata archaeon]|nr:hypothetical protein [Thermoplasmata archaeon]
MAYDIADGYLVLNHYGSTWIYRNGTWTDLNIPGPPRLDCAGFAYDAADRYILQFGGLGARGTDNQTWAFSNGNWTELKPSVAPPARWLTGMAYDAEDGYILLEGGERTSPSYHIFNDTWSFRGGNWTQQIPNGTANPGSRACSQLAYDSAQHGVVLFGGCREPDRWIGNSWLQALNDTWSWQGGKWTHMATVTTPQARMFGSLADDAGGGSLFLFGGSSNNRTTSLNDTWELIGSNWTKLTPALAPTSRSDSGFVWDPAIGCPVLFGGSNSNGAQPVDSDTWVLTGQVCAGASIAPGLVDVGQTASIALETLPSRANGTYSYVGLPTGCASQNASVLRCTPTQDGIFQVTATVSWPSGDNASRNATLVVHPDPRIDGFWITPAAIDLGDTVHLSATFGNGTLPFAFDYRGLPVGCSSRNASSFNCTPRVSGTSTVELRLTDSLGWTVSANASLGVNPDPSIVSFTVAPFVIDLGQTATFLVAATGGTGTLSYRYAGLPLGCSGANLRTLVCVPRLNGTFSVSVAIGDISGRNVSRTTFLTVNLDPVILSFEASRPSLDLGRSTTFNLSVAGGTGSLATNLSGLPPGCTAGGNVTFLLCRPTVAGNFSVVATVMDAVNESATAVLRLVVAPALVINSFAPSRSSLDLGQTTVLSTSVSGGLPPDSFRYSGLPTGCAGVNQSSFQCVPSGVGSFGRLHVDVQDAAGSRVGLSSRLEVAASLVIVSFEALPARTTVGAAVVLVANVTGGTGPSTFEYTQLPPGCSSTNNSTSPCVPSAIGTFNVSVAVTDEAGSQLHAFVTLVVDRSSPPPPIWPYVAVGLVAAAGTVTGGLLLRRRRSVNSDGETPVPDEYTGGEDGSSPALEDLGPTSEALDSSSGGS